MTRSRPFALPAALAAATLALAGLVGCGSSDDTTTTTKATSGSAAPTKVSIALDWTPNTNHTGVYVAQKLGYYKAAGLDVQVLPYASTAPETLVNAGKADFGFSYQAGTTYARAGGQDVVSVFAATQKNSLELAVKADSGITSPKDLDGKTYAGFGTPDEKPQIDYVIKKAGGKGSFKNVTLSTSAYEAVYAGKADFTLSYATWEGIEATRKNKPLRGFKLTDYGFPESYAALIVSSSKYLKAHPDVARKFLAATQKGYAYTVQHPKEASDLLVAANPQALKDPGLVQESTAALVKGYYADGSGAIGRQTAQQWKAYDGFLYDQGVVTGKGGKKLASEPDWSTYFTNDYLPAAAR
jgi:ABC-type nitrate/sulfonate/bicarbonate transport system substrate-binding protein